MDKSQIIAEIQKINPLISVDFLIQFSESDLTVYLDMLKLSVAKRDKQQKVDA